MCLISRYALDGNEKKNLFSKKLWQFMSLLGNWNDYHPQISKPILAICCSVVLDFFVNCLILFIYPCGIFSIHPNQTEVFLLLFFVDLVDRSQIPLACFYFGKICLFFFYHIVLLGRTDRIGGGYALSEIKIHLSSPSAFECFYLIILDLHIQLTGPCSFVPLIHCCFPHF